MDLQELQWLRAHSLKFTPELKNRIFSYYRQITKVPCFLQRIYHFWQQRCRHFPVIIQLTASTDHASIQEFQAFLTKYNKKITVLTIINSLATTLSLQALKKISSNPLIRKIYLDQEVRILQQTSTPSLLTTPPWSSKYTGQGVTLAFLDTGLAPHPDLFLPENRLLAFQDFINKETTPYDDHGHGTHCTARAIGNGSASQGKYQGPAPQAKAISLKVLNKMGIGLTSTTLKALEWVLLYQKKFKIKVLSLSLGYRTTLSYREDPLCQALEKVFQQGIIICTAAGNDGPDPQTINTPGIHPHFITVGALNNSTTVADFSSRGPTPEGFLKPDLLLPGYQIISARAQGSLLDRRDTNSSNNWYLSLSGTSTATSLCAGLIAQLLEAHPHLTPMEVKKRLQSDPLFIA